MLIYDWKTWYVLKYESMNMIYIWDDDVLPYVIIWYDNKLKHDKMLRWWVEMLLDELYRDFAMRYEMSWMTMMIWNVMMRLSIGDELVCACMFE